MELKTYSDFKRKLAEKIQTRSAITPESCSGQTKTVIDTGFIRNGNSIRNTINIKRGFLFEEGNGAGVNNDILSNVVSNHSSTSNYGSRKRLKTSDRLSPLSLLRTQADNNANSCNNSVVSSSNSSINTNTSNNIEGANQAINNNVPFATNSWWKKGNEHLRELMSTSINSTSALSSNANNSCDNSRASNSISGNNNNDKKNSNETTNTNQPTESMEPSSFAPNLAMNNVEPRMIGNSISTAASPPLLSSATPEDQKSSAWLQLLGEVASSGGNNHHGVHHAQHQLLQQQQQELQAMRMQENIRASTSNNNHAFLALQSPLPYSNAVNKNQIPRMAIQSRLQQGHILDPSIFPPEGMNVSQMHLQQQQFQQQQQQHIQSLYPYGLSNGLSNASTPFFSTQNSFLQRRQNQRQQMQRPEAARAEIKIEGIRTSGDIGEPHSLVPAMERELEESYQQNASFDEEGGGNVNEEQKGNANNNSGDKRKDNIEIMDDLVFSDIAPMITTSGAQSLKVEGFDSDVDVDIDVDAIVSSNINMDGKLVHQHPSHSPSSSINKSKPSPYSKSKAKVKEVKFRAYQAENWTEKFEELLRFREQNGHCLVPNCHPENPALAQWTKRQRYQYKLKHDGKRSTITDERVRALDEAGFVWDSHKAVWSERLEELKEFKKEFKHCNVPSRYKPNHQLAIWVKRQRRQWKNKLDRLPNCMTDERQRALEIIGFIWDMKKGKRPPANNANKERAIQK